METLENIDRPLKLVPREETENIDIHTDYQSDQETREIKELIERQKQHLLQSESRGDQVLQQENTVEPNPLDSISLQKQTDYVNAFGAQVEKQERELDEHKSVDQLMSELRALSNARSEAPLPASQLTQ